MEKFIPRSNRGLSFRTIADALTDTNLTVVLVVLFPCSPRLKHCAVSNISKVRGRSSLYRKLLRAHAGLVARMHSPIGSLNMPGEQLRIEEWAGRRVFE